MADDRETLGRLVRETWVAWAQEQPEPKDSWLLEWDDLPEDDPQREVDMRIGSAVAAQAVADAKLRNERTEARLLALGAHRAAIFDALRFTAEHQEYPSRAKRYRAALEALGGSEGETP